MILNRELLEEVDCFIYLWSQVASDGGCEREVVHRTNEGIKAKKYLYELVSMPMALYGAETWGMRSAERIKVNVLEMKCLRSLVGVS